MSSFWMKEYPRGLVVAEGGIFLIIWGRGVLSSQASRRGCGVEWCGVVSIDKAIRVGDGDDLGHIPRFVPDIRRTFS